MLSVVVNFFNNRRESVNSLFSMTREYQQVPRDTAYEVIVLDHGSSEPLSAADIEGFGREFKYRYVATNEVSPARAINEACRDAAGDTLMVVIDGAHVLTPGIFGHYASAFDMFASPFVVVPAMHLGPMRQNLSVLDGYDQRAEDLLLDASGWRRNGYRLYTIARDFADGGRGWFGALYESNCFAMRKDEFLALGGYETAFQLPGGGLVNLDLFNRAVSTRHLQYVMVMGECSFHQFHCGVSTNATRGDHPWARYAEDYARIRGRPYQQMLRRACFIGAIPPEAVRISQSSLEHGSKLWGRV